MAIAPNTSVARTTGNRTLGTPTDDIYPAVDAYAPILPRPDSRNRTDSRLRPASSETLLTVLVGDSCEARPLLSRSVVVANVFMRIPLVVVDECKRQTRRSRGPVDSFGPTWRAWSVAGLPRCLRGQFGHANPNPGRYELRTRQTLLRSRRPQEMTQ